jgi:hypothetical protein
MKWLEKISEGTDSLTIREQEVVVDALVAAVKALDVLVENPNDNLAKWALGVINQINKIGDRLPEEEPLIKL